MTPASLVRLRTGALALSIFSTLLARPAGAAPDERSEAARLAYRY